MNNQAHFFQNTYSVYIVLAISGMLMIFGCSDDGSTGPDTPQVTDISISPKEVSFAVGEELDFSVFALTASGDTVDTNDIDIEWQWRSTDSEVFTVEPGGNATGQSSGEAFCVVEAIVEVSLQKAEEQDVRYAEIVLIPNWISNGILKLEAENAEKPEFHKVGLMNMNKMRFTGRDSALVMVF